MAFLSIKKRLQKKKPARNAFKAAADPKPSADDSERTIRTVVSDSQRSSRSVFENTLDPVPDSVESEMYGYEDATPDTAIRNSSKSLMLDPYGYELHTPSAPQARPRRSSMKGSNPTNGRTRPPRRRHSISFQEEVTEHKVVPITEMVQDKGDMWLQGEDYYNIIHKVNAIVERTASGKGQKFCTRGLEKLILKRNGMEEEDEPQNQAWDAVLDEQDMQHTTGDYDEEQLSRMYRRCSNQSLMEAKARAMQDENEVSRYLADTRAYCRRMSM